MKVISKEATVDGLTTRVSTGTVKVTLQVHDEPPSYTHLILTKDEAALMRYGQKVVLRVDVGDDDA